MERLMEMPVYGKHPETKMYEPRMITKLVYNFRSHAKIIEFSNKTFYDGDLLVKGLPGNYTF
jgi:superfamily I DNA and/or RNA helicase